MSRILNFKRDDENDTRLFDKMQEYVLEHYPNPNRIGCLDRDTLNIFVETPEKLDLTDHRYLHIFNCAECTRDLGELRRIRDERLRQALPSAPNASDSGQQVSGKWTRQFQKAVGLARAAATRFAAWWKARR